MTRPPGSLLVIFGAGASFDSVPDPSPRADTSWRPPLASTLFENRDSFGAVIDQFPLARPIISELRTAVRAGRPVEDALQDIDQRSRDYPPLAKSLLAVQFYLQEVTWRAGESWSAAAHGITNYVALASRIEEWRYRSEATVLYVTFNYDLMLEEALRFHAPLPDVSWYAADGHMTKVFKLHGSANWGREVMHETTRYSGDQRSQLLSAEFPALSDKYRILTRYDEPVHEGTRLMPVIAMPIREKSEFACPPDHVEALVRALPLVTHILIIGWRAQELHFLRLMAEHLPEGRYAHVVAASADGPRNIANALAAGDVRIEPSAYREGFSQYVSEPEYLAGLLRLPVH